MHIPRAFRRNLSCNRYDTYGKQNLSQRTPWGGGKRRGVENLTNDTPPKKGFWTPPRTVRFPPPSGVSALFFLYKNPRQSRPEALLEGSKNFRESAFSGTFSSPHTFCTPPRSLCLTFTLLFKFSLSLSRCLSLSLSVSRSLCRSSSLCDMSLQILPLSKPLCVALVVTYTVPVVGGCTPKVAASPS